MAFSLNINGVSALFTQAFSVQDKNAILDFVSQQSHAQTVLFLDTPATPFMVEAISALVQLGKRVVVRDHHDVDGEPSTPRELQIRQSVNTLKELLGPDTIISNRRLHPSCAAIALAADAQTVIVADPDSDGLLAAMTSCGVTYDQLMQDADLLDGAPGKRVGLSPLGQLINKCFAMVPPYDPSSNARQEAIKVGFGHFVAAVQGDSGSLDWLTDRVNQWQQLATVATQMAADAEEIISGVFVVDSLGKEFDRSTLMQTLEKNPKVMIVAVRSDKGIIAKTLSCVQYSLSVASAFQKQCNLQNFMPAGVESSPQAGLICNTTFLLHCSEQIWTEKVLPSLRNQLSAAI